MSWAQASLIVAVRLYRYLLSPLKTLLFGALGRCRFSPTCSAFALEALQKHGAVKGGYLALRRVARCHPWGGCGYDPVPEGGRETRSRERGVRNGDRFQVSGSEFQVAKRTRGSKFKVQSLKPRKRGTPRHVGVNSNAECVGRTIRPGRAGFAEGSRAGGRRASRPVGNAPYHFGSALLRRLRFAAGSVGRNG